VSGYGFENLSVWQKSVDLVESVYGLTKSLPRDEKSGLIDQIRRAVTSISLNIAEGWSGQNAKIFLQFLEIAHRSLHETVAILKISERLYRIPIDAQLERCEEVSKMLTGLKNSIRKAND
jgi:four helix bundle protein